MAGLWGLGAPHGVAEMAEDENAHQEPVSYSLSSGQLLYLNCLAASLVVFERRVILFPDCMT